MRFERMIEARIAARELVALIDQYELERQRMRSDIYVTPKLTGAIRRRSMDLTRALAEMRKP